MATFHTLAITLFDHCWKTVLEPPLPYVLTAQLSLAHVAVLNTGKIQVALEVFPSLS